MHHGNGVDTTAQREPARTVVCGFIDATTLLIEFNEMKGSGGCCHAQLLFLSGKSATKPNYRTLPKVGLFCTIFLQKSDVDMRTYSVARKEPYFCGPTYILVGLFCARATVL